MQTFEEFWADLEKNCQPPTPLRLDLVAKLLQRDFEYAGEITPEGRLRVTRRGGKGYCEFASSVGFCWHHSVEGNKATSTLKVRPCALNGCWESKDSSDLAASLLPEVAPVRTVQAPGLRVDLPVSPWTREDEHGAYVLSVFDWEARKLLDAEIAKLQTLRDSLQTFCDGCGKDSSPDRPGKRFSKEKGGSLPPLLADCR